MKTRMAVTVNIQRSTLTRLAMTRKFISPRTHGAVENFDDGFLGGGLLSWFEVDRGPRLLGDGHRLHDFFEHPSPVFVVLKLVEAGAGRSEENDVADCGGFAGPADSVRES